MSSDPFTFLRGAMVRDQLRERGIQDVGVLTAMRDVPRHEFLPPDLHANAYEDHPLPIGSGQTISQPYMLAIMLQHLELQPTEVVLEVGTGSGYASAVLSRLCAHVYSIERHAELARSATQTIERLRYPNVTITVADGNRGWPEHAPFDAVLVSAATPAMPLALFEELREGGRIVIPVGSALSQQLQLVRKVNGRQETHVLEGCRFVPLVSGEPEASGL